MRKLVKVKKTGMIQATITDVETFKSKEGILCNKCWFIVDGMLYEQMIYNRVITAPMKCAVVLGNKVGKEQYYDIIRLHEEVVV